MSALTYSVLPTSRTSLQLTIHDNGPQMVWYDGELVPVEEVVCDLLCSGMNQDQVFRWLERRMRIGQFAKTLEVM